MSQNHRIKRQILEISFPKGEDSQAIQNRFRALFYQQILPEIERNCDRLIPTNVLQRIERLEIDLGEIRTQHFEEDILKAFRKYFPVEMRNALHKGISGTEEIGKKNNSDASNSYPLGNRQGTRNSGTYSALGILENFAQTGLLPWWAGGQATDTLGKAIEELVANPTPNIAGYLTRMLSLPISRKRLWAALKRDEIIMLFQLIDTHRSDQFWDFLRRWMDNVPKWAEQLNEPTVKLQAVAWDTVFSSLRLSVSIGPIFQALFFAFKAEATNRAAPIWGDLIMAFLTQYPSEQFHDEVATEWKRIKEELIEDESLEAKEESPSAESPMKRIKEGMIKDEASKTTEERSSDESQLQDTIQMQDLWGNNVNRIKRVNMQLQDGITIYNAGLVLLSPFLRTFFEHLGWTNGKEFSHLSSQQRAVYLLQYLAIGDSDFPEYQLPLNKLMVGLPIETPIELENPLLPEEMAAGDELLEVILGHAKHLGLTSVDGLRGSFLLREGILRQRQKNWSLHVKAETYDIVLHHLPWSYQVVKLPWMPEPLFVEWQIKS